MTNATPSAVTSARRTSVAWPLPVAGLAVVTLLVIYPPFRVVSRTAATPTVASDGAVAFDPVAFAAQFWSERLQPAGAQAPSVAPVLAELRRDPVAAANKHARRVGLGSAAYAFVRGSGRIVAVERGRVLVELDGGVVALRTGPVFGNIVRDGCGLLEVNQVPGLAEFNALSAELNRLVEARIQPALKAAAVGAAVTFAGCAEMPESLPADGPLLTFIPVQAEVTP